MVNNGVVITSVCVRVYVCVSVCACVHTFVFVCQTG